MTTQNSPSSQGDDGYEGPDIEASSGERSALSTDTADDLNDSADSYVSPARSNDSDGEVKPGGLGQDGTIPDDPDGVAAGHTGEPSTFEPEEDEQADA
jgi:hypothetical protein